MIKRLRRKFIVINMAIVTVMLVVIFSLVVFFMGMTIDIENRQLMEEISESAFRPGGRPGRPRDNWRSYLVVRSDAQGNWMAEGTGSLEETTLEEALAYVAQVQDLEEGYGMLREENLRYWTRPTPFGQVVVFLDISGEMDTMGNLIRTCGVISVLSFCVFWIISIGLARWAIRPVETAWNQQRQFVADASHELKTPLTVIMTNAELMQSPEYGEEDRRRFAGSILAMSQQMRGLVESLLDLARVDNGAVNMVFSMVDLSELVAECLLPFEPMYFERELTLESRVEEGLYVKGSAAHLRQVVEILLDNGAKYASPQGCVEVTLKRQGNHCLLSVSNPGEPIGKEDLQNIFKRFYRIDKARTMNHSYGLGLAIADSVVREHGGKIWAESENGRNTFFVQLTAL